MSPLVASLLQLGGAAVIVGLISLSAIVIDRAAQARRRQRRLASTSRVALRSVTPDAEWRDQWLADRGFDPPAQRRRP